MDGLLLFAHGARDAAWARPFEIVSERLRAARPGTPLVMAYLEFMSPGMEDAAAQLAAAEAAVGLALIIAIFRHARSVHMDDFETHDDRRILPGAGFTIEPGLYFENLGGVRIENLATIVQDPDNENFLRVQPLTFCPLDERLIDYSMLDVALQAHWSPASSSPG